MADIGSADKSCKLCLKDGRLWCETHELFHLAESSVDQAKCFTEHPEAIISLPMRHVLYTASYCTKCDNGFVILDEEQ